MNLKICENKQRKMLHNNIQKNFCVLFRVNVIKNLFFYAFPLKICDYSTATLCSNLASIHLNLTSLVLVLNKIHYGFGSISIKLLNILILTSKQ